MFSKALLLPLFLSAFTSAATIDTRTTKYLKAYAHVTGHEHNIDTTFDITGYLDGRPTEFKVNVKSGLTDEAHFGPFSYHVHTNPIGPDGDCTKALSHLDPYNVTESIVCNPKFKQFCQEGDLSGKHGKLEGTPHGSIPKFSYTDRYVRFFPEEASILGRSIVIHNANKTRIACGNIISVLDGTADWHGKSTHKPSNFVTHLPKEASPNPKEIIDPFKGDKLPSQHEVDALPFPLPLHAIKLSESIDIAFKTITRRIKVNHKETDVKQPKGVPISGKGPFAYY